MSPEDRSRLALALDEVDKVAAAASRVIAAQPIDEIAIFAASGVLQSFYTEIEKALTLVARSVDGKVPSGERWHRLLVDQLTTPSVSRPALVSLEFADSLKAYLRFRHVSRNASIVIMEWGPIEPLLSDAPVLARRLREEFGQLLKD